MIISESLRELLKNSGKRHQIVQVVWATAKSVDWDTRTMVATGVIDELDYLDVRLGLGAENRKPKIGSKCLLGIIQNIEAKTYLIHAEELELIESTSEKQTITSEEIIINEGNNGGIIVIAKLQAEIEKLNTALEILKTATLAAIAPLDTMVNTTTQTFEAVTSFMQSADLSNVTNDKIKH